MAIHESSGSPWSPRVGPGSIVAAALVAWLIALPLLLATPGADGAQAVPAKGAEAPQPKTTAPDAPDEEERAATRQVMRDNCLICHSEEMISGQRLTLAQWKAEVEKMIGWGSPVPPEQAAPLIEYLAAEYSENAPETRAARMTFDQAMQTLVREPMHEAVAGAADRGAQLYSVHCATCHGADAQGADLGPNLVGIAFLVRPTEFRAVVRDGKHRMPGFKSLLKSAQEDEILTWLRGRRYRTPEPKAPGK